MRFEFKIRARPLLLEGKAAESRRACSGWLTPWSHPDDYHQVWGVGSRTWAPFWSIFRTWSLMMVMDWPVMQTYLALVFGKSQAGCSLRRACCHHTASVFWSYSCSDPIQLLYYLLYNPGLTVQLPREGGCWIMWKYQS